MVCEKAFLMLSPAEALMEGLALEFKDPTVLKTLDSVKSCTPIFDVVYNQSHHIEGLYSKLEMSSLL